MSSGNIVLLLVAIVYNVDAVASCRLLAICRVIVIILLDDLYAVEMFMLPTTVFVFGVRSLFLSYVYCISSSIGTESFSFCSRLFMCDVTNTGTSTCMRIRKC